MGRRRRSINDVINEIYEDDIKDQTVRPGWRFYVHLNKLFAPMEREGLIKVVGEKQGRYRMEKLWERL